MNVADLTIDDLRRCVEAAIPPIVATASAAGEPNVVFVSSITVVDAERVALSNQFMGKTANNLAENPRASLILIDPDTNSDFRLSIVYERTERRGPVFERLRAEIEAMARATATEQIFKLRSAEIYRIERIDVVNDYTNLVEPLLERPEAAARLAGLGELTMRLSRCGGLDTMVTTAVRGLDELLGYRRSTVMLVDEAGERLYTIASHGFDTEGVGSEIAFGVDAAGIAAERNRPVRLGGVQSTLLYASSIGTAFDEGDRSIPLPASDDTRSRLAVPAVARGEVRGVIVVESSMPVAFDDADEAVVGVIASIIAEAAESATDATTDAATDLPNEPGDDPDATSTPVRPSGQPGDPAPTETHVRFFVSDGSVFLDGDYLIRGVAGRVLWSMVQRYDQVGQVDFTMKELRLDSSLQLPGYRDNLDTRVILLQRRLDERTAPIRIVRTGRGRIALRLNAARLRLEAHS